MFPVWATVYKAAVNTFVHIWGGQSRDKSTWVNTQEWDSWVATGSNACIKAPEAQFARNHRQVLHDNKLLHRASVTGSYALERTRIPEFEGQNQASDRAQFFSKGGAHLPQMGLLSPPGQTASFSKLDSEPTEEVAAKQQLCGYGGRKGQSCSPACPVCSPCSAQMLLQEERARLLKIRALELLGEGWEWQL